MMKVTDIYIKKDWSVIWQANAKVLDKFQWNSTAAASHDAAAEKEK